jgi:hypothetical protein
LAILECPRKRFTKIKQLSRQLINFWRRTINGHNIKRPCYGLGAWP